MKTLLIALCMVTLFSVSAYADLDEYYKYVDQYTKDRNAFLDLKERAMSGDIAAQSEIGTIYFEGRPPGLPQNLKKAHKWFKMAADQGDSEAQYRMGFMSTEGMGEFIGVEGDDKKARKYVEKSAKSGHREAQKMMMGVSMGAGFLNSNEKDLIAAYKWAGLAKGEGEDLDTEIEESMKELEKMMTSAELARAKGMLKREINKRGAHKGGMGAYGRSRSK
jgi:TPR repeat protein